jgi:hypothetical protein
MSVFDQAAVPLATPTTLGAWYRGWRPLLAVRLFAGAATWRQAQASGAALAWRVRTGGGAPRLHPERILADGSWLSRLDPEGRTGQPVVVRVLE